MSTERLLVFSDDVFRFREGMNCTVRRGVQWAGASGLVPIARASAPAIEAGRIYVHYARVKSFYDLESEELALHHAGIQTFEDLLDELQRHYEGFDGSEVVTVLVFGLNYVAAPRG